MMVRLSATCLCLLTLVLPCGVAVHAQTYDTQLPLKGQSHKPKKQKRLQLGLPIATASQLQATIDGDAQSIYDLIKQGNPKAALELAGRALEKAPNSEKLLVAYVNALYSDGQHFKADQVITKVIDQVGMNDALLVLRETIRRQLAVNATYTVYRSLEKEDHAAAIQAARETIVFAPDVMENRLLLINLLMNAQRYAEAEQSASEAITIDPDDVVPWMLRGYTRQYVGQRASAVSDFDEVLRRRDLTPTEQKHYRAITADAAMAAAKPYAALDLLEPLGEMQSNPPEAMITWRRRAALAQLFMQAGGEAPTAEPLRPLILDCRTSPYGRECDLLPAMSTGDPAYGFAAQAFTALKDKDHVLALSMARLAVALDPQNADYQILLLNTLTLNGQWIEAERLATDAENVGKPSAQFLVQRGDIRLKLGKSELANKDFADALQLDTLPLNQTLTLLARLNRNSEARDRLTKALKAGEKPASSDLALAYLASNIGDDDVATSAFQRSDLSDGLGILALQDAAYASVRSGHDQQAIAYLIRAVDAKEKDTPLELRDSTTIQSLLNIRRTIAEVSRSWGAIASVSFRGATLATGAGLNSDAASNDSVQIGTELYWRPYGYRNGKLFEIYARAFETPYSSGGGLTGASSLQGSVGMRLKPFSESNMIFAIGNLFPVNSKASRDWLAQVAYSNGEGGELRVDTSDWWTQQVYVEAGHYLQQQQSYGTGNARWGRSYRLDDISSDLVAFPHAVLAADYNTDYAQRSAVGFGVGLQLRYWYRQDTHNAHRSYVDFSLQYRTKISGDEQRAKGTFFTVLTSY